MWDLVWILKDWDERFSDGGASCWWSGGGWGGGRWILADFVAHLSGDVAQALRHRLALLKTLDAPVQEADPAEQQVRVVAQSHGGDGGDSQQLSSRGASADITPLSCLCFLPGAEGMLLSNKTNKTEYSWITEAPMNNSQIQWICVMSSVF